MALMQGRVEIATAAIRILDFKILFLAYPPESKVKVSHEDLCQAIAGDICTNTNIYTFTPLDSCYASAQTASSYSSSVV